MTDLFVGLHRGPIDHEASSVINAVSNGSIDMGGSVTLAAPPATELLPRVEVADAQGELAYGIAVGGDVDGTYGDGAASTDDTTRAVNAAGQGVVVVTQGRCKAQVTGTIAIGDALTASAAGGLEPAAAADEVIAIALQASTGTDMAAVDVQRQGIL